MIIQKLLYKIEHFTLCIPLFKQQHTHTVTVRTSFASDRNPA